MIVFAVDNDPPVHDQQIIQIHKLWATRKLDTFDIAKKLGLKEFQVANLLLHLREGRR